MNNTTPTTTLGSCHHDCPDTCMWEVSVVDGTAVRLRGSSDHPTTRGELCPKVNRLLDRIYHPTRLTTPVRRSGPKGNGNFLPISWDEALDEITAQLTRRSPASVLQFSFDGTQGVVQKGLVADRFFDLFGASDIDRHLCGVTSWLGAADVSGVPFGIDPEDLALSNHIILWGTNTLLTNRHLWPVIETARRRGAQVVTIDPLRTATARRSDDHFQLRPGSDVALVGGLIHVLERDGLLDGAWLTEHTSGWDDLRASVVGLTPERTAQITGITAERIVGLAHDHATRRPAAVRVLVGPEHRARGRDIMRAIATLPAVSGAWRDRGGGLARSTQAYFEEALAYPTDRPTRRRFNMADLGSVLNDPRLDPPIETLFVHNSNPAVICPDQEGVLTGLRRTDLFTVVVEQFMTDTARYADIVLPATSQLEHLDLGIAWGHLYLSLNRPAIEPVGDCLPNSEIFRRLGRRMGLQDPILELSDEEHIRRLLDSGHPWLAGIDFDRLQRNGWVRLAVPVGHRPNIDTSPATPDGRLHLAPLNPEPPAAPAAYPLMLFSPKQHSRFLNTNYGAFPEHHPLRGRPTVMLHPDDARDRRLANTDQAAVWNERGKLTVEVEVTDEVPPGSVAIPFGWWHGATLEERSVNVLTNPTVPDDAQGSAAFGDTFVEVASATSLGPRSAG